MKKILLFASVLVLSACRADMGDPNDKGNWFYLNDPITGETHHCYDPYGVSYDDDNDDGNLTVEEIEAADWQYIECFRGN